jgi:hypothetical protein
MALLSKCCEGCSFLVREKCNEMYEKSNKPINFVFCDTQNVRLLIEVGT